MHFRKERKLAQILPNDSLPVEERCVDWGHFTSLHGSSRFQDQSVLGGFDAPFKLFKKIHSQEAIDGRILAFRQHQNNGIGLFLPSDGMNATSFETPIISGLLEGYQTYDALAGLLTGGIVVISLNNFRGDMPFEDKRRFIARSGLIAMSGLFIIYAGLIAVGALHNAEFEPDISRTELLSELSLKTLGNTGSVFLSVLIGLACLTTAIGVIVGTADFFAGLFKNSKRAYLITAILSCIVGVVIGQLNVKYIIDIALPVLMFIYPLTIVLILLNLFPDKYASKFVFRMVVLVAFVFSIPDFLSFMAPPESLEGIKRLIPFAELNMGWVLPSVFTFLILNIKTFTTKWSSA